MSHVVFVLRVFQQMYASRLRSNVKRISDGGLVSVPFYVNIKVGIDVCLPFQEVIKTYELGIMILQSIPSMLKIKVGIVCLSSISISNKNINWAS